MCVYSNIKFNCFRKVYTLIVCFFFLVVEHQQTYAQQRDTLEEMVVSANRIWEKKIDIPQQINILSQKKIQEIKPLTNADLLENTGTAFIQKSQQGGGSPVLRGFEANKILLVIDGVRMNNAIYRSGHLQNILRIDPFMLERIEIVYGPSSVMYGSDALGGVIHLMTKKPVFNKAFKGEAVYRYNSINNGNTFHLDFQKGFKKIGFLTGITYNEFDDLLQGANRTKEIGNLGLRKIYQSQLNGKDILIQNANPNLQVGSAYSQLDLFQSIVFQKNKAKKHLLNFQLSRTGNVPRYDRLSEFKNDTPVFANWHYGPEIRMLVNYQIEHNTKHLFVDHWKWNTAYQWIEESRINRNFGKLNENNRIENVQVISSTLDLYKQINKHELRYGIDFQWNDIQSKAFARNISNGIQTPISTRYPDNGSQLFMAGIYMSHSTEISNHLILNQGIRLTLNQLQARFKNKNFYSFLPDQFNQQYWGICGNIGLVWMPLKKWKFTAQSGNGFRAPNMDDLSKIFDSQSGKQLILPNPNLKPEIAWTNEIGIAYKPFKGCNVSAQFFYTYLFDVIVVSPFQVNLLDSLVYDDKLTRTFAQQNKQFATIKGLSIELSYQPMQQLIIDASINTTYGRLNADSTMPLDHIPPTYGRMGLNFMHKKWNIGIWSIFNGSKNVADYYLNGEDNFQYATPNGLPGWYTLNTQLNWFPDKKKKIQLTGGIENCLDKNYRTFSSGISAPGRNFKLGISIQL